MSYVITSSNVMNSVSFEVPTSFDVWRGAAAGSVSAGSDPGIH